MAKKISKGSFINLHGSKMPLRLASDAMIEEISDQAFVGALLHDKAHNWPLNVDNYPGNYNPVTGAPMLSECQNCGREIPVNAANQKTCEVCLQTDALARASKAEKKATKRATKRPAKKTAAKQASGTARKK